MAQGDVLRYGTQGVPQKSQKAEKLRPGHGYKMNTQHPHLTVSIQHLTLILVQSYLAGAAHAAVSGQRAQAKLT